MNTRRSHLLVLTALCAALLPACGGGSGGDDLGPLGPSLPDFVHEATTANIALTATRIDHPLLDGQPEAILIVTHNLSGAGGGTALVENDAPTAVQYADGHWWIVNQGLTTMAPGTFFNVSLYSPSPSAFVHTATSGNIAGNWTNLSHGGLDGTPSAVLVCTQTLTPPGRTAPQNIHAVAAYYHSPDAQWTVYNEDRAAMPVNAAFNVVLPGAGVLVHQSAAGNTFGDTTWIDDPGLNGLPDAFLQMEHRWVGAYIESPLGIQYSEGRGQWGIFRTDGAAMDTATSEFWIERRR